MSEGDANQHIGMIYVIMEIAAVLSVPVLFETGISSFEEAVVVLLTIVALLLVMQ